MKLNKRTFSYVALYLLSAASASIAVHEAAHVCAALALGVPSGELKLGFYGINPSVTLPAWFTGRPRTTVHYAGGLATGSMLLLLYLACWVRRYRCNPSILSWSFGLVTITLAEMQLAFGYLEGRYHAAYIAGAGSLFSLTDILTYGLMLSGFFLHFALNPRARMKRASQSMQDAISKTEE